MTTEKLDLLQEEPQIEEERLLTISEVEQMHQSFSDHIAQYWDIYQDNFAQLGKTMMVYDEFVHAVYFLPENFDERISHTTNVQLGHQLDPSDNTSTRLETSFRTRGIQVESDGGIDELICLAQPMRVEHKPWLGYEEPLEDTPEAYFQRFPESFVTIDDARKAFADPATRPNVDDRLPFAGFTTVAEFPEQTAFLDLIRLNRRVRLGIEKMERMSEQYRLVYEEAETKRADRRLVTALITKMDALHQDGQFLPSHLRQAIEELISE